MNEIKDFIGEYEFLSNPYPSAIVMDGELYKSVEHAFQASKTDDLVLRMKIRDSCTAKEAKKIGGSVILIQDWNQKKRLDVMSSLIRQKFTEHTDLKLRLLMTGDKNLIQGNTWNDCFWGQNKNGIGENHVGKILMNLRAQFHAADGGAFQTLIKYLQCRKLNEVSVKLESLLAFVQELDKFADMHMQRNQSDSSTFNFNVAFNVNDIKSVLNSLK